MSLVQEARRRRVLEAAIDLLAEVGWERTTMAAIARRAKISKGLISYHFSGKDEVLTQVVETIVSEVFLRGSERMQPRIAAETTARGMLRAYIESNLEFVAEHWREMRALSEILPNLRDEEGRLRYDVTAEEPIIAATAAMLEHGQRTGEFRDFDAHAVAFSLRRAIDAAAHRLAADPTFDIAHYASEIADLYDQGCRA
ncbi:TetR/AcrR family transcriptional regulator [Bailinhaonella thermotolerans]|uniref:TetR/AcrR family transcriptional regulator n=1 Tax=Bailinhaonella thermotolerans TaxID=1070861 RepID=UPI00192A3CFF|nr:TetR/AcrR family transcriptional regulator [Bailinhaonella thermotolerans]